MTEFYLFAGDNRHLLANMGDDTVDSIVTDPPYELTSISKRFGAANAAPAQYGTDGAFQRASGGFMGQLWDSTGIAFDATFWAECLRVLKPGGHLIAFSGSRTYHRMACAIDDAGFEIRDQLLWLYGSGFPKSHDVSKAIDKAAGAERAVIGFAADFARDGYARKTDGSHVKPTQQVAGGDRWSQPVTAPATPEAQQWQGWGTALKPAHEPMVLARKPLAGTVAGNVLLHGVGGLNIDGCRVPASGRPLRESGSESSGGIYGDGLNGSRAAGVTDTGRFPANVLHDGSDPVVAIFPQTTSGSRKAGEYSILGGDHVFGRALVAPMPELAGSSGSAARFFYCAKASKADREDGCGELPKAAAGMVSETSGQHITRRDEGYAPPLRGNTHPTVKPTELMRWLVRLVTPPGGLVFDPFTGSGSTGRAAMLEGARFIGAEMTDEYIPIARARIEAALTRAST